MASAMIEPLPWRPASLPMKRAEVARQDRLARLRPRPRRTRVLELTPAGVLVTAVRTK